MVAFVFLEELKKIFPTTPEKTLTLYLDYINANLDDYEVNTVNRVAMFLAQVGHESNNFKNVVELHGYSRTRLLQVFPKYFNSQNVDQYVGQPEKIFSRTYGNRYGNGPESTGDGWKYRGRGLIQTTFRANYQSLTDATGVDFVNNPDLLTQPEWAVKSAFHYWKSRNLNPHADAEDVRQCTLLINGGLNGLEHREALYKKAKQEIMFHKG